MCDQRSFQMFSYTKLLVWFCFLSISKCQEYEGCITPDRESGNCLPVTQCQPMANYLASARQPIPQTVKKRLNAYTCSFKYKMFWVCCPPGPIVIDNDSITSQPPMDQPRPPPDVTKHRNYRMLPEECGYLAVGDKIRNGINAHLNEFPWMALLSYKTSQGPQFHCGGTIINDRYILTAAHCISNLVDPLLGVRVGEHNIKEKRDCEVTQNGKTKCADPVQNLFIEEIIPHPRYNATVIQNDIGLLRVSNMNVNVENVRPVCLPVDEESRNAQFRFATVTGWGVTDSGQTSMILQKIELPVDDLEECKSAYKHHSTVSINYKQLCAGGKDKKGICPGDSGGPLHSAGFVNDATRYFQQGIVSFGPMRCGLDGFPEVFTRVAHYMDWILDTIRR